MNLSELNEQQLAALIRDASAELSARLSEPTIHRVPTNSAVVVLRDPPDDDRRFLLQLKTIVAGGGYVTAADRQRAAELAAEFGPWVKRQGLPTVHNAGAWQKLARQNRIKTARER